MPEHATVYAPIRLLPGERHLRPLAEEADIVVHSGAGHRVVLTWPDLRVSLTRMEDAEMAAHLAGLVRQVRDGGGSEALATRALSTLSVYGFTFDPGFDDEARAMSLLVGVCGATDGLCFLDGRLHDAEGVPLIGDGARPLARPSPQRVAARALVLLAVATRGLLDDDAGKRDEAEAEALRQRLVAWVDAYAELASEIEPHESKLLRAPIGAAPKQATVNGVWGAEGACVLLWALRARPLPPHDVSEHPFEVSMQSGVLADERPALLDVRTLRPADELSREQRRLLAIHWRMVEARVRGGSIDFARLAEKEFLRGVDLAGIPVAQGDLEVGGQPLTRADPSVMSQTASIAVERHRAANWLIGVHPVYSRVATPT